MKKFIFINKANLIFVLLSLFSTIILLGTDFIWSNNTQWIHNGSDFTSPQTGWHFFKNDYWRFPLGNNPNYGDEVGSSIVFSDSIPILALLFKSINSILPKTFQYFSFWYLVCFYLQLFFSYKILKHFTKSEYFSILGSLFFLSAPIFIYRIGINPSLSGQWILLLTLYLAITKTLEQTKIIWILLLILSSLIHFYFTVTISLVFGTIRIFNFFEKKEKFFQLINSFIITFVPLILVMYIIGYFEIRALDVLALGFGNFKLNLLSFFHQCITKDF